MADSLKKRGQKIIRRFSRNSIKASERSNAHIRRKIVDRFSHVRSVRLLILEWSLLVVALIMLAVTQAFWFGDSYAENTFTSGGTYTEATIGEVNSMNPLFATTNSEKVLSKLMFATVSAVDYSGHPGNQLTKYIKTVDGGLTWVLKLRDNLKWSDGEPITNQDVLFTAKLIKNPSVNTVYKANLANVKIAENEKGEIVFTLPSAYADFMSALDFPLVPQHILGETDPQALVESTFSNAPVTSGPFTFNAAQSNGRAGEKVFYLSANPSYYAGQALLNNFAVHTYNDKESVLRSVNDGTVTATAELSGADAERITAGQFNQRDSSLSSGAFLFFNMNKVKNKELRDIIRQGLNLELLRNTVPEVTPLDYPLVDSQIQIDNYPKLPPSDYESAKAKLTKQNENETIHLDVATVNSGYLPSITQTLTEQLKDFGFDVNMTVYEENQEFINSVVSKRAYDILVYEIELGADPDLLPYYHSSQANTTGLNLSNYRNVVVDDLLLGARGTMDNELRAKKYEAFLQYWISDIPAIGLYQSNLTYYYNKNVRTFSNNNSLVTALDRFSDVTDWSVVKTTKNKTP